MYDGWSETVIVTTELLEDICFCKWISTWILFIQRIFGKVVITLYYYCRLWMIYFWIHYFSNYDIFCKNCCCQKMQAHVFCLLFPSVFIHPLQSACMRPAPKHCLEQMVFSGHSCLLHREEKVHLSYNKTTNSCLVFATVSRWSRH